MADNIKETNDIELKKAAVSENDDDATEFEVDEETLRDNSSVWKAFMEGVEKEKHQKEIKAEMDKIKMSKKKGQPMKGVDWIKFAVLMVLAILFIVPILLVLMNSFKGKLYVSNNPFELPNSESFVGIDNYIGGMQDIGFVSAFINTLIITVFSVGILVLATAMCAWYIVRVKKWYTKLMYLLFACSMIVPFQMVMYPMSYVANTIKISSIIKMFDSNFVMPEFLAQPENILNIIVMYLGFGAGLSVFMFAGFVKSVPVEIEEAAMIDGCGPIKTFFMIDLPIMKPSAITVAILNAMWIWNDYLLPTLILPNDEKSRTLPMAIQYLRGGYGSIDMAKMMAMLVLAIIPIIIFYFAAQKYIIKGVVAGAVKG